MFSVSGYFCIFACFKSLRMKSIFSLLEPRCPGQTGFNKPSLLPLLFRRASAFLHCKVLFNISRGDNPFSTCLKGEGLSKLIRIGDLAFLLRFYAEYLTGCYFPKISDRLNLGTSIANWRVLNSKQFVSESIFANCSWQESCSEMIRCVFVCMIS